MPMTFVRRYKHWLAGAVVALGPTIGIAGEPLRQPAAPLMVQAVPGHEHYFAIALKAPSARPIAGPVAHILLVDTSASQIGSYRVEALSFVEQFLAKLPDGDTVQLVAVDVNPTPLTSGFVAADSSAAKAGLTALQNRVPLGTSNLAAALEAAVAQFPVSGDVAVTYVGDGVNSAGYLSAEKVASLCAPLRDRQAPVHSYGVGPGLNPMLLGLLAQQTGGFCLLEVQSTDVAQAAKAIAQRAEILANATHEQPLFGSAIELQNVTAELFPAEALPLRSDRETIYLGSGQLASDAVAKYVAGDQQLEFPTADVAGGRTFAFLPALVERARASRGISNALAGMSFVGLAADEFDARVSQLVLQGEDAALSRDAQRLSQVAGALRQLDPTNDKIEGWLGSRARIVARPVSQVDDEAAEEEMVADDSIEAQAEAKPGASLLLEREQLIRVITEKLRQQVSAAVQASRASSDAAAGIDELKRTLATVRAAVDIDPQDRIKLEKLLEGELLTLSNRIEKDTQDRIRSLERTSQLEAQKRLVEQALLDEERLNSLIERVRSLMSQGWHGDDPAFEEAEQVANVAINLRPGDGTSAAARFNAEAATQLRRSFRLRALRADEFLETLHQVELSHVPFPDEPPIRFPSPQVWKALTERRAKYKSVDLRRNSPTEARIQAQLASPTEVDFADTSLTDAITFIEDLHKIEIYIDNAAISEEGVATDTPINLSLSGVTLRSVLRLMLTPLGLTYIFEDEVMKITTIAKADEALTTRVYPVADLVIPITQLGSTGGLGGGIGGGGQGGGGFGGGQQGGGGFGGGGQGGGGGFFSLPPEPAQHITLPAQAQPVAQPQAVDGVKKND